MKDSSKKPSKVPINSIIFSKEDAVWALSIFYMQYGHPLRTNSCIQALLSISPLVRYFNRARFIKKYLMISYFQGTHYHFFSEFKKMIASVLTCRILVSKLLVQNANFSSCYILTDWRAARIVGVSETQQKRLQFFVHAAQISLKHE